jgi:hypothetical protein
MTVRLGLLTRQRMEAETKLACCARRPAAAGERETSNGVPTRVEACPDARERAGNGDARRKVALQRAAIMREENSSVKFFSFGWMNDWRHPLNGLLAAGGALSEVTLKDALVFS